jgi:cysteine desulfurase
LLVALKHELAFATGSACATTKVEPSHVILALGYSEERAKSSIRLGLGRSNTEQEVDRAIDSIAGAVEELTHKLRT